MEFKNIQDKKGETLFFIDDWNLYQDIFSGFNSTFRGYFDPYKDTVLYPVHIRELQRFCKVTALKDHAEIKKFCNFLSEAIEQGISLAVIGD